MTECETDVFLDQGMVFIILLLFFPLLEFVFED
jgi:hypothetical protein